MDKRLFAIRMGRIFVIPPDAAGVRQDGLVDVVRQRINAHALDPDVSRLSVLMLAELCPANILAGVLGSGEVAAGDMYRLSEVISDFLQALHQFRIHKDWVTAIPAVKLPHLEIGGELFFSIPRQ